MNKISTYQKRSYINVTVRIMAFCLGFILLVSGPLQAVTVFAETKNSSIAYTLYPTFRITLDGTVYETRAYVDKENQVYITDTAAKKLFGGKATGSIKISDKSYYSLAKLAKQNKVASYEYDSVIKACYLWTDEQDSLSDESRISYYKLGKASEQPITYKAFFQLLDKTVKLADADKLKGWSNMHKQARASSRKMTRLEGMMAILYMAVTLGPDYGEFNTSWSETNQKIGEAYGKEIEKIRKTTDPYQYLKNPYPYNLGGFKKDNYVYEWDAEGVAYRYAFGRISLYNNKTIFDYDADRKSMHLDDMMTYADALNALSRFLDSVKATEKQWVSLSDQQAVNYNSSIITSKLLKRAEKIPEPKKGDLSGWSGFVLNGASYDNREINTEQFDFNAKQMSEWGFPCVRYMITYQTLFDKKVTKVNQEKLQQLDKVVAAAIKYNIHLNLVTFSMPGKWAGTDDNTFTSSGEFDLFVNKERQKEAYAVWDLLARRYQKVPGSVLSFCPLWESNNFNLSTGLPGASYTPEQIAVVYEQLVKVIKKYGEDRLVIYEPTADNREAEVLQWASPTRERLQKNYDTVQLITNFCEEPYVYSNMTAVEGENIDNNNRSMYKPSYPNTIYASKCIFGQEQTIEFNGDLVKGTKIQLYLKKSEGDGNLIFTGDDKEIYKERLSTMEYDVGAPLSRHYLYAKSDKCITVTLKEDTKKLILQYDGDYCIWCGIDITLPKKYEVERWWNPTSYDVFLEGKKITLDAISPKLKKTSRIILCPNSYDPGQGDIITIHSDISFTSNAIYEQSNKETINRWGDVISEFAPKSLIRCEGASFDAGTDMGSAIAYYTDFLDMCKKKQLGWLMNDYDAIFSWQSDFAAFKFGGAKVVPYRGGYLLVELLRLYQKYSEKPRRI